MRNISAAAIQKILTKMGVEPVYLVEVQWEYGGPTITYGDKHIPELGINGQILDISSIENIINISKSSSSQSVNVTLDDVNGVLKNTFNNTDIHKKPVWIYQYFTGTALSDRILLFRGEITSPITWKESERTLSFDVTSSLNSYEVGFSPEEGDYPNLPPNLVGKTWPIIFGRVFKAPGVRVDEIPSGT